MWCVCLEVVFVGNCWWWCKLVYNWLLLFGLVVCVCFIWVFGRLILLLSLC